MQWLEEVKTAWTDLGDEDPERRLLAELKLGSQLLPMSTWVSQTKSLGRDAQEWMETMRERLEWKLLVDEEELVRAGAAWTLGQSLHTGDPGCGPDKLEGLGNPAFDFRTKL